RLWEPIDRQLRPVREELAALAPGRVLPFAPGNSRKRGPGAEPRSQSLGERRSGAPEGERASVKPASAEADGLRRLRTLVCGTRTMDGMRLSALRFLFMSRKRILKERMSFVSWWLAQLGRQARRENEFLLPLPARGEGVASASGEGKMRPAGRRVDLFPSQQRIINERL